MSMFWTVLFVTCSSNVATSVSSVEAAATTPRTASPTYFSPGQLKTQAWGSISALSRDWLTTANFSQNSLQSSMLRLRQLDKPVVDLLKGSPDDFIFVKCLTQNLHLHLISIHNLHSSHLNFIIIYRGFWGFGVLRRSFIS